MTLTSAVPTPRIRTDHDSALHAASQTAHAMAQECGLTGALPDQAAVIASELASNIAMTGQPGIVGWRRPTPTTRQLHPSAGTAFVLHTDGIDTRWSNTPTDFLLRLPPSLLAAVIAHRHRHSRDDATVLTACSQEVTSSA